MVGALVVALLLLLAPNLLQDLPTAALAAVVIASAIGLFEITDLSRIYRIQQVGVLAVDRLLRRRGGVRRHPRHRPGGRDRRHRIPVGRLASAFGGARPRRRRQGLSRHHALPERPPDPRSGPLPLGCTAVLRQRRVVQGSGARGRCASRQRRCAGWSLRRNPLPASMSPQPTSWPNWTRTLRGERHRIALCRAEGSGKGQAEALRAVHRTRRGDFLPDHRCGGKRLSRQLMPVEWDDWEKRELEQEQARADRKA